MNDERRKSRNVTIVLFLLCICTALACFGIFICIAVISRSQGPVSQQMITVSKIIVMTGIFFLVLAFGHLLPILISYKNMRKGESDMSEIFDETNMREALDRYIPSGETLLAGIHAIAREINIKCIFSKCIRTEHKLIPDENGVTAELSKKKNSTYDIYIGITQSSLVFSDCETQMYLYDFKENPNVGQAGIQEVTSDIYFTDIGKCFPLADIQSCEIKKGWMGSVKCRLTMKNGSYFRLLFPKLGGLGGGMPHHTKYREAIIARLNKNTHLTDI